MVMSHARLVAGLDLGTTNAKVSVFDSFGECVVQVSAGYNTYSPQDGWYEQHPADWETALVTALAEAAGRLSSRITDVAGMGVDAHGPGLVLVDDAHHAIAPSLTWHDNRADAHGQRLLDMAGPGWVGSGLPKTGLPAKLFWALENWPEAVAQARWAMGVKDYVTLWLTGQVCTDYSSGPGGESWYPPVFQAIGWPLDKLPPVVAPTTIAGELRQDVARITGWPPRLPIVAGMSDGAASTLGGGVVVPGEAIVSIGTNAVMRFVRVNPISPEIRLSQSLFCWPYVEGRWVGGGFAKSGGAALTWFGRTMGMDLDSLVSAASSSPPGSRDLIFLPFLTGRGSPAASPDARGAFLGIGLEHDAADMARAVVEGVVFALRDIAAAFQELGTTASSMKLTGGGGKNLLWRQVLADNLSVPVEYKSGDAALGAAITAAVGVGLYDSIGTAVEQMAKATAETTMPDLTKRSIYDSVYVHYVRLRDRLAPAQS